MLGLGRDILRLVSTGVTGGGGGPTPPPYTPPLDGYPNAAAAYSVRLLRTAYSGSALRVQRAVPPYDEQDIGFTAGGDLDEAAIVAFGGSDSLGVSAWYDQSGNAVNATQITYVSQPQIYNGTAVITENGKPIIEQTENVTSFSAISLSQLSPWTAMGVSYSQFDYNRRLFTSDDGAIIAARNKTQLSDASGNISIALDHNDAAIISTGVHNGSSSFVRGLSVNASGSTTGTMTGGSMTSIQPGAVGTLVSSMQEFILWPVAKTSTEYAAIESDMDTYFNVT